MAGKSIDWRPGPTVCRCCLTEGCYKDISTEYFWMGKREVYSEMLLDSFDLSISYSQSGAPNSNSRLICEPCISRLRDAADFKRQVIECEKTFKQLLDPTSSTSHIDITFESEKDVKLEKVKLEKNLSDDEDFLDDAPGFGDDDDDDLDDQPLTKLATKIPKKEAADLLDLLDSKGITVKRKATAKAKVPAKKSKTVAKPSASKIKLQTEPKKKKESDSLLEARRNAMVVLKHSTVCPFKIPNNSLVCVYCCEAYDEPSEFRTHMRTDHTHFNVHTAFAHNCNNYSEYLKVDCTEMACRICSQPFDQLTDVGNHLYKTHGKKINMSAEIGMQMFKLGKERWICAMCKVKLPSLRRLSRHTTCHYHKYTCETCGKSYISRENLNKHILYSHTEGKRCLRCKETFPSLAERRSHIEASMSCWGHSCCNCGQRFLSKNNKIKHLREVHGHVPKLRTCPDCGEVFEKWNAYRTHFILAHTNDNFECSNCGLKFDSKRCLNEHKVMHTKEKSFPCTVCSKAFGRKKNLEQHMWIHREVKRFECTMCNKQFNQRVSWKTHMKSYHPDLVNF